MINIIYISDSNKHFDQAICEYQKRLGKSVKFVKIKPSKTGTQQQIIQKDTEKLNQILLNKKDYFNILLSLEGKQLDTLDFSKFLQQKLDQGININFIIGGAFGLNESKLQNIDYKLNLSKLTFPHSLALLILLEQIYRALQIIHNRNYHY